jgi:hypothetical protein
MDGSSLLLGCSLLVIKDDEEAIDINVPAAEDGITSIPVSGTVDQAL